MSGFLFFHSRIEGTACGSSAQSLRLLTFEGECSLAAAYAVTKVLLPIRLIASVWATPWFARVVTVPVSNSLKRLWKRKTV